jgi:hypothetical protein
MNARQQGEARRVVVDGRGLVRAPHFGPHAGLPRADIGDRESARESGGREEQRNQESGAGAEA